MIISEMMNSMKLNEPLVCICIPNYNNEKTVAETLDSLIAQTYKNIVIKVFDNASTDSSIKILREYEKKYDHIHVFEGEKNIGAEGNFTKCIENMEGEYSAIYHSDDIYMPTIIEEEVKYLRDKKIGAIFTMKKMLSRDGVHEDKGFPNKFSRNDYYEFDFYGLFDAVLKYGNFINTPSVMAVTALYKEYIVSWENSDFATSSDLDVWFRICKIMNIGMISKPLLLYRFDDASFSFRRQFSDYSTADFIRVMSSYLKKHDHFDARFLKIQILKDELRIQRNKLLNGLPIDSSTIKIFDLDILYLLVRNIKGIRLFVLAFLYKFSSFFLIGVILKKVLRYRYKSYL